MHISNAQETAGQLPATPLPEVKVSNIKRFEFVRLRTHQRAHDTLCRRILALFRLRAPIKSFKEDARDLDLVSKHLYSVMGKAPYELLSWQEMKTAFMNSWLLRFGKKKPTLIPSESAIIDALFETFASSHADLDLEQVAEECFKGAHILVYDKGALYDKLAQLDHSIRGSSHYRDYYRENPEEKQIQLTGPTIHALLTGKIVRKNRTITWFQLEGHPVRLGTLIRHLFDYVLYSLSGYNVGPRGYLSKHTESQWPIELYPKAKSKCRLSGTMALVSSRNCGISVGSSQIN